MKIIHLSDLHLGKRLNEYSLKEDQEYILNEILNVIDNEKPNAVIIAGDVYDKSMPSAEAVEMFDNFIFELSRRELKTFVIYGNHDSPERIAYGGRILSKNNIFVSPVYNGDVEGITLGDDICVYLLPFIRPADTRRFFPDEKNDTYTDALRAAVNHIQIDKSKVNIIAAHQFVTASADGNDIERCDSEINIGGLDNVAADVFSDFDYVALGHIHNPQKVGRETVRYCGTPLKYSLSEINHQKSVTVIEINKKNDLNIRAVPLKPLRDIRRICGTYEELVSKKNYEDTNTDDYIYAVLTNELDIPNAFERLGSIYPNIIKLEYLRENRTEEVSELISVEERAPIDILEEFFREQTGRSLDEEQRKLSGEIFQMITNN